MNIWPSGSFINMQYTVQQHPSSGETLRGPSSSPCQGRELMEEIFDGKGGIYTLTKSNNGTPIDPLDS